jgi:hypothetical protein
MGQMTKRIEPGQDQAVGRRSRSRCWVVGTMTSTRWEVPCAGPSPRWVSPSWKASGCKSAGSSLFATASVTASATGQQSMGRSSKEGLGGSAATN